jgi:hypothetical protein
MAGASPLLWVAAGFGLVAVGVLRRAWSLPRRSSLWNGAGWALLLIAIVMAGQAEGTWGIAIVSMAIMTAALAALAVTGIRAEPGRAAASNRRVGLLPEGAEPRHIGRRFGTFALVMVGGLAASLCLALGIRGLGGLLGWHEANANALALFTLPVGWAILATIMLMQSRRRGQWAALALCSLPLLPVLLTGALT